MKRSGIHVFMPAEDDAWVLLALDLHELAQRGCKASFKAVKSLQLCANMAVRTVFSSNIKYDWEVSMCWPSSGVVSLSVNSSSQPALVACWGQSAEAGED